MDTSVGICLCREHPVTGIPEVLLVKKRTTWCYSQFLFGNYQINVNNNNNKRSKNDKISLQYIVNNLTSQEKIQIMSGNFNYMWYHLWLFIPGDNNYNNWLKTDFYPFTNKYPVTITQLYKQSYARYQLLSDVKLNLIHKTIIQSAHIEPFMWEIPKGGMNSDETLMECAIREFEEETTIPNSEYIIFNKKIFTFNNQYDININKQFRYYAAVNINRSYVIPTINFYDKIQIKEIDDIKWFSLKSLNMEYNYGTEKSMKKNVKKILSYVIRNKLFKQSNNNN